MSVTAAAFAGSTDVSVVAVPPDELPDEPPDPAAGVDWLQAASNPAETRIAVTCRRDVVFIVVLIVVSFRIVPIRTSRRGLTRGSVARRRAARRRLTAPPRHGRP